MNKTTLKKLINKGGFDLRRYRREIDYYKVLYKKYSDYTMIPEEQFVLNLELCWRFKDIEGDYVECGVWRGGISAAISEILPKNRDIHLFDSFEGLPPATEIDGNEALNWQNDVQSPHYYGNCKAEEQFVVNAMALAKRVNYVTYKGWFDKTLSNYSGNKISILRLDGDWYDSILTCMQQLYPKVVGGGIIILDDYYTWDGCAKAIHDYLSLIKAPSRIYQFNNQVAYIIKKDA